jgi:quercetin dioxygenase-like cupin family protein
MSMLRPSRLAALALVSFVPACSSSNEPLAARQGELETPTPAFTMGSGSKSTLLGRAKFSDSGETFKVKRITGDWHVEIKSKPAFDLAVQSIVFGPGAQSGWHSHPGPVFIQVVSDSMTFYESDDPTCTGIVRRKGEGYLDVGAHAHIARNETADSQRTIVTYFAPPGADLRIDEPSPGNCPF